MVEQALGVARDLRFLLGVLSAVVLCLAVLLFRLHQASDRLQDQIKRLRDASRQLEQIPVRQAAVAERRPSTSSMPRESAADGSAGNDDLVSAGDADRLAPESGAPPARGIGGVDVPAEGSGGAASAPDKDWSAFAPIPPSGPPERSPMSFDRPTVQDLYAEWCRDDRAPDPDGMEVVPLDYVGRAPASEFEKPSERFQDAAQVSWFVRFTEPGGAQGFVFPHPQARYDDTVHPVVFPQLDRATFNDARKLADLQPRKITRTQDSKWETDESH